MSLQFSGARLNVRRRQCGLTQEKLGQLLGVSPTLVGFWERGQRKPSSVQIHKLADALGCPDNAFIENLPDEVSGEWQTSPAYSSDILRAVLLLSNASGLRLKFDTDKSFKVNFEDTSPALRSSLSQLGYLLDAVSSGDQRLDWQSILDPWAQKQLDMLAAVPLDGNETQSNKPDNEQIERDTRSE